MHSTVKELIVYLIVFALGSWCCYYHFNRSTSNVLEPQNQVEYELEQKSKEEHKIKDIASKEKPQELMDFQDMDKKFYTYLENCEPLNIKTKNGYIEYIIEGITDDKCMFKHRQIGFMDTICALPIDVAKKYSEEGMNIIIQLENLRAQNKSGFVNGSQYINDINNNKTYCRYEYYQRKK